MVSRLAMSLVKIGLVLASVPTILTGANAQVVASDPKAVALGVGEAGYLARVKEDSDGDPQIVTKMSGWTVIIYFYGCVDNKDCQSIQFRAGFDRTSPMKLEDVNEWNAGRRFGTVSLDEEGDPYLSWDIILNEAIPQTVFAKIIDIYDETVGDFSLIAFNDQAEEPVKNGSGTTKDAPEPDI